MDPDAELFIYSPWNYTVIDSNNRVFGEFSPVYSQSGYIQRIYPGDKLTAKRQLHSIMNKSRKTLKYSDGKALGTAFTDAKRMPA